MGKFKSEIWQHYKRLPGDRYECKFCKIVYKHNATRQLKHTLSCPKVQEDVRKKIQKTQKGSSSSQSSSRAASNENQTSDADDDFECESSSSPEQCELPIRNRECPKKQLVLRDLWTILQKMSS